jgi:predicted dehydrogenase
MGKVRVGIIGVGGIAHNVHIKELEECRNAEITAVCDTDSERLKSIGDELGLDEKHRFQDYRELIACSDVDAVEVCTPNCFHTEMAVAAIEAGKAVNMEKPMAMSAAEAEKVTKALDRNPVPLMMSFSYRFKSAVRYAKHLLDTHVIGDIISVNVSYLKDSGLWSGRPIEWRFLKKYAGTGVLGDLGVHLLDMAVLLAGDIRSVCCRADTVVKKRPIKKGSDVLTDSETDDYCYFIADFQNGATGMFTITRCALGYKNTIQFDVFGTEGSISFDLDNSDVLGIACAAFDPDNPNMHYVDVPAEFQAVQEQCFIDAVNGKDTWLYPGIADGIRSQKLLDALVRSGEQKRWVTID